MKKLTLFFAAMVEVAFGANAQGIIRLDAIQSMYAGIENPITVAASGYDSRNLSIRVADTVATFKAGKEAGGYMVRPRPGVKKLTIDIVAKTKKGKMETVGSQTFVIRNIPAPILKVCGVESGGRINRNDLTANTVVIPLTDPNFIMEIDNKYLHIIKMYVAVGEKEEMVMGPRFNESIASLIKKAEQGDKLLIVAEVVMPDGKFKEVPAVYTIMGEKPSYEPAVDENGNPIYDKNGEALYRKLKPEELYEYYWDDEEDE